MIWKRNNEEEEEVAMISIISIISGAIFDITRQLHGASQLVKMDYLSFWMFGSRCTVGFQKHPKVILWGENHSCVGSVWYCSRFDLSAFPSKNRKQVVPLPAVHLYPAAARMKEARPRGIRNCSFFIVTICCWFPRQDFLFPGYGKLWKYEF